MIRGFDLPTRTEHDRGKVIRTIGHYLIEWVLGGIPPTEDEHEENFLAIERVLQNMVEHYSLEPTSMDWLAYEYLKQSKQ